MKDCDCEKCKECCTREAGWFMPEEIPVAAKYLELSEQEFISKYCTEHIENGVAILSPSTKKGKTECIFLDKKGLCTIHPVKPYECRKVFGCQMGSRHKRIREIISRCWK